LISTFSELKARLERLGPVQVVGPPPLFSGALIPLVLRLDGPLDKPVAVAKRLYAAGLTLKSGHMVINRLAETRLAVCRIAEGADIPALATDLAMNVHVFRRRHLEPGQIAEVRTRHGLSQREFAEVLGLDIDTLQNWEQGRNRPDPAALSLVMAFDKAPDVVTRAGLEPVI
jgi:DNA-binding XRE family transcriptional regulator